MRTLLFLSLFSCFLTSSSLWSQDIEALVKATPLSISGGINVNANYYNNQGGNSIQPPFFYTVGANLNLNFFGIVSAPLSFRYSPTGNQFNYPTVKRQPFNQMGISPKYKWLTVHLGYRSMNFSKYTYSGARFFGGGIEVKPQKIKLNGGVFFREANTIANRLSFINTSRV